MSALAHRLHAGRDRLSSLLPTWTRMRGWAAACLASLFLLANGLALDWWYAAHARLMKTAPSVVAMGRLNIALVQDQPITVGRAAFGQAHVANSVSAGSAAAIEQIRLILKVPDKADPSQDYLEIRNIAASRRLWLEYANGFQTFAERFPIPPGSESDTRFTLGDGAASITLRKVSPTGFQIWTCLSRDPKEVCRPGGGGETAGPFEYAPSFVSWLKSLIRSEPDGDAADSDFLAAYLGGFRTGPEDERPMQIGLHPILEWKQLQLVYRDGKLFLAPGLDMDRATFPITMEALKPDTDERLDATRPIRGFTEIFWKTAPTTKPPQRGIGQKILEVLLGAERTRPSVGILTSLIAGRTNYAVTLAARAEQGAAGPVIRTLSLRPTHKIMLFPKDECRFDLPADATPVDGCPTPVAPVSRNSVGCADGASDRVNPALPGLRDIVCSTKDGILQQWGTTTSADGLGSSAFLRVVADESGGARGGDLSLAPGAVGGWKEIAISKWLPLAFALFLAILLRPRGASDLFLDDGSGSKLGRMLRGLRGRIMRAVFLGLCLCLALAPEGVALAGRFGGPPWLREGLDAEAALRPLLMNWALAGIGLVLFAPRTAATVSAAWLAVTVMAAIGALTLASLAVDGPTTRWAGYYLKHRYLFLDVVPVFAMAVAVMARARVRRAIRVVLLERSVRATFARCAPPALMLIFFMLWAVFGSQTGIGGFQPIEAGKFVSILLIAALVGVLVGFVEPVRLRIGKRERWISLAVFSGFLGALMFAPYFRSDFSPLLIVLLLGATVGLMFTVFAAIRVLWTSVRRKGERGRLPLAFRPKMKGQRGWPAVSGFVIGVAAGGLIFQSFVRDYAVRELLHVEEWKPAEKGGEIASIIAGMGQGRHVPAQRFITMYDLDFGETSPRADFRNMEYHLIRSRTEVAYGNCSDGIVSPNGRWWSGWLVQPLRDATADLTVSTAVSSLCRKFAPPAAVPSSSTQIKRLGESISPIEIPLAENDFTPAYMLARFGIGLGVALFLAQSLLVFAAICAFVRILLGRPSGRTDANFQQFVGVMLAGSVTLYILQWMLSWSNVIGLLPIMGQPMTWVSSGNSHHLLMALPCLTVILLALKLSGSTPELPQPRMPPERDR